MQVNSISPSFQARKRDNVDSIIFMDDATVRQVAYARTQEVANDKRHKRLSNALIAMVPLAAGLASARGGRFGKLARFGSTTAKWYLAFGVIDLLGAAKKKIDEKSKVAGNFAQNHPLLSFAGFVAASLFALRGTAVGLFALGNKIHSKYGTKIFETASKVSKKLDSSKFLDVVSESAAKFSADIPQALKNIGRSVLDWSPAILVVGDIIHQVKHENAKARIFANNYNDIKNKQEELAKRRIAELRVQNEFLQTQNDELSLAFAPFKGLPQEVVEKIRAARASKA